jgi:hypothetical protein
LASIIHKYFAFSRTCHGWDRKCTNQIRANERPGGWEWISIRRILLATLRQRSLLIDSKTQVAAGQRQAGFREAQPVLIHFSLECSERVSPVG